MKGSRSQVRKMKRAAAKRGLCAPVTQQKHSAISLKRAKAQDPALNEEMFRRFGTFALELYTEGKIPQPYWGNDAMWGGDEIGFDPDGSFKSGAAFSSPERLCGRNWDLRSEEKSAFWATVFFWVRMDGQQVLPPCLIHQGTEYHGEMFTRLFEGKTPREWLQHASPSGYADEAFFKKCLQQLAKFARVKPCIAIVDGHGSHECLEAWEEVKKDSVYGFFLKANDSIRDQVRTPT